MRAARIEIGELRVAGVGEDPGLAVRLEGRLRARIARPLVGCVPGPLRAPAPDGTYTGTGDDWIAERVVRAVMEQLESGR